MTAVLLLVCSCVLNCSCGGSQFESEGGSNAIDGGSAGAAGASGSGGTAGTEAGVDASTEASVDAATDAGTDAFTEGGSIDAEETDATADVVETDAGPVPIVVVQTSDLKLTKAADVAPSMITMPNPPVAGNTLIVGITCMAALAQPGEADCSIENSHVTDSQGNEYIHVVESEPITSSHQAARGYLFVAENILSSAPFEITVAVALEAGSTRSLAWGAIEVSGLASPSVDAVGSSPVVEAPATSTTVVTNEATEQANSLAVAVFSMRRDSTYMAIHKEVDWVSHHLHQNSTSANLYPPGHSMVSKLLTEAGKVSHTWTHDEPGRGAAAIIATFKGIPEE
jgi:hypothetical protein